MLSWHVRCRGYVRHVWRAVACAWHSPTLRCIQAPLCILTAFKTQLAMQRVECASRSLAARHGVTPLRLQVRTLLLRHGLFRSGACALPVRGARGAGAGSVACRLRRTVPADGQHGL